MCSPKQQWMLNYQHCPAPTHHLMMTMTCLPYIKTTIGRSSIGTRSLTQQMKTSFRQCYRNCYCQSLTQLFLNCGLSYADMSHVQVSRPYCKSLGKHDVGLMLQSACVVARSKFCSVAAQFTCHAFTALFKCTCNVTIHMRHQTQMSKQNSWLWPYGYAHALWKPALGPAT